MSTVSKLLATDETFREVAELLYGGGADELVQEISKRAKTDREKFERRQAQVGLASNVVGITAGVAALKDASGTYRKIRKIPIGMELVQTKKITGRTKALAAGAVGLQAANIAGDAVANRVLARGAKKKEVKKSGPDGSELHVRGGKLKIAQAAGNKVEPKAKALTGQAKAFTTAQAKRGKNVLMHSDAVNKAEGQADEWDITWEGEISKVDTDKRQVFGWASIVEKDGQPVTDLQGDYISVDEIEKSAYEYVINSRKGGDMHRRDGDTPVHVSDMIESFLVTPEKIEKMGLPDTMPLGWWVGYQINDDKTWQDVKNGKRMFSIHGRGMRTPL